MEIDSLFKVHLLNEDGKLLAVKMAEDFTTLLSSLSAVLQDSRDFSIVKTKLQEACFFAKRALATQERFQEK